MFIEANNIERLFKVLYEPNKEYLPPDLNDNAKNIIYVCIVDNIPVKAYNSKESANEFVFNHNRYSFTKANICEVELLN